MDHEALIKEMSVVEKMKPADRIKYASKKRQQQLEAWSKSEKRLSKPVIKQTSRDTGVPAKRVNFGATLILLEATTRNDVEEVTRLLNSGVNPDVANEDGLTSLHQCCIDNYEEMVKVLLAGGANVNAKDSELWTPLHAAATCGHRNLCDILIQSGADLLAVNSDGNMPYDICEEEASLHVIEEAMFRRGVSQDDIDQRRNVNEEEMMGDLQRRLANGEPLQQMRDRCGGTPLHVAAANGYVKCVEFLLNETSLSVRARDNDGWEAAHAAACWGQVEVLELLVNHGADLSATTSAGERPIDLCEDAELQEFLTQLEEQQRQKQSSRQDNVRTPSSVRVRPSSGVGRTSRRSSSVRRSSIKEKTRLSWLEAREEGRRMFEPTDAVVPDPVAVEPSPDSDAASGSRQSDSSYGPGAHGTSSEASAASAARSPQSVGAMSPDAAFPSPPAAATRADPPLVPSPNPPPPDSRARSTSQLSARFDSQNMTSTELKRKRAQERLHPNGDTLPDGGTNGASGVPSTRVLKEILGEDSDPESQKSKNCCALQ